MKTPDEIAAKVDAARKRAEAATSGPWTREVEPENTRGKYEDRLVWRPDGYSVCRVLGTTFTSGGYRYSKTLEAVRGSSEIAEADAAFIASAREDVPFLCDAYDAEKKRADELQRRLDAVWELTGRMTRTWREAVLGAMAPAESALTEQER